MRVLVTWPVLGVDPGGTYSGIVLRDRVDVVAATVVQRGKDETMASYIGRVIDTAATYRYRTPVAGPVAVEGLNEPTPQMGLTSVGGLIGAAQVLGGVLAHWPDAIVVPPGGHGSAPLLAYPAALKGERERVGAGILKHARSAWDVALAGYQLGRVTERVR